MQLKKNTPQLEWEKISGLPNITRIQFSNFQKNKKMRQNYFIEYVPSAYMHLCFDKEQQMANNQFVYDFKSGNKAASRYCGELLIHYLSARYGKLLKDYVVVFAPCSSQAKYNKRFAYVAAMLRNILHVTTANEHVHIYGERKPLHNGGSHNVSEEIYKVSVDGDFFKGKNVILFDDLLTSGKTIGEFKSQLEAVGAYVEEEIFLGRTVHHDPISMRGCLQEMEEGFYESVARSKRCFPSGVNVNKKSNHKKAA